MIDGGEPAFAALAIHECRHAPVAVAGARVDDGANLVDELGVGRVRSRRARRGAAPQPDAALEEAFSAARASDWTLTGPLCAPCNSAAHTRCDHFSRRARAIQTPRCAMSRRGLGWGVTRFDCGLAAVTKE